MIVSHKHKFIFIKTSKTAGTSMMIFLSQFCADGDLITHLKKQEVEYSRNLGYQFPRGFKTSIETFKLSAWKMIKEIQADPRVMKPAGRKVKKNLTAYFAKMYLGQEIWNNYYKFCFERNPFDRAISHYYWHTRNMENRPDINEYIQKIDQPKLSNWRIYTIEGRVAVDFVGRYENLEEDKRIITERLGLPNYSLPTAKGGTRKSRQHYSQILNQESRRCIERMCANEIEKFNYGWVDRGAVEKSG